MLNQPTADKLRSMGLTAMAESGLQQLLDALPRESVRPTERTHDRAGAP